MTTRQRILCLDAACTASEYPGMPENIRAAVSLLAAEINEYFEQQEQALQDRAPRWRSRAEIDEYFEQQEQGEPSDFGVFLAEQREAIKELSRNPAVFGAL